MGDKKSLFELAAPDALQAAATMQGGQKALSLFERAGEVAGAETPMAPEKPVESPTGQFESNTLFGSGKAETALGEFGAGLQSATRQILSTPPALAGLMSQSLGMSDYAQMHLEYSRQIAEGGAKRGIGGIEDLTSDPMTWVRYVSGVLGEAVPYVLSIWGGGGSGTLVARALAKRGVDSATKRAILAAMPTGGAVMTGAAIETGVTAQELHGATGKVEPLASAIAGSAKGSLEAIFPFVLARQFGLPLGQATGLWRELAETAMQAGGTRLGRAAVGAGIEGATEALQEEIDIRARAWFDRNYEPSSQEAWLRRANAFVAGGVGGGVFSSLAPQRAEQLLNENAVRESTGSLPYALAGNVNEIPVVEPETAISAAQAGLDMSAGLAAAQATSQALDAPDLRGRGFFAAVVPGRELVFGSQEQAAADHGFYQGTGFQRLNGQRIGLGDVSAALEDLPATVASSRVAFEQAATLGEATDALSHAINIREQAAVAQTPEARESLLDQAEESYRTALGFGARVTPLADGRMVLRDARRAAELVATVPGVRSMATQARLGTQRLEGRQVFDARAVGGLSLDLERVEASQLTALPERGLVRRLLANPQISRKLDLARARGQGVYFTEDAEQPQRILQEFVELASSLPYDANFRDLPQATLQRFLALVDRGLRLDVVPETESFISLVDVGGRALLGATTGDAVASLGEAQSGLRGRARVTRQLQFDAPETAARYEEEMRRTILGEILSGEGRRGSPLVRTLRNIAQNMQLRADFTLNVVPAGALGDVGVSFQREGEWAIIEIDPWFYGGERLAEFWSDFSFQFGKILVDLEWGRLGAGRQEQIQIAFQRERHAASSLDAEAGLARLLPHPVLERALRSERVEFDFQTWLFSNIARVMAEPQAERQLGPVAEFLNRAGRTLRGALMQLARRGGQYFGLDPRQGRPHQLIEGWVRELNERSAIAATPHHFLTEATRQAALESIERSQNALDRMNLRAVIASPERASTVQVRELLKHIPADAREDTQALECLLALNDRHSTLMEWFLGVHQIADLNPHITGLRDYVSLTRAMEGEAQSWAGIADERLREMQQLPSEQLRRLWDFMIDLDRLGFLDAADLDANLVAPRWPTGDELLTLTQKHRLDAATFAVYREIRTDYLHFLSWLEAAGIRNVEEHISDEQTRTQMREEVAAQIAQLRTRPYFPHMRFGKYAVTIRNARGGVVYFGAFESEQARARAIQGLIQEYNVPADGQLIEDTLTDELQQFQGLPRFALNNVIQALGLNDEYTTAEQQRTRQLLEAMAYESSPQRHFSRQLLQRQHTPGFSADGMRAYAAYFSRASRFVSRMNYSARMEDAIERVRRDASPISRDSRTRISAYLRRHYEAQMQPAGDLPTLRSLAFSWYFAFVPAAAFVNLTQLPLVTGPFLAGQFGDAATGRAGVQAVSKAMENVFAQIRGSQINPTPLSEAVDQAHQDRLLDDGFAAELAALSHGSVLSRTLPGNKFARGVRMVAQWGTLPFQFAERINRRITFDAAYNLAIENPQHESVERIATENAAEATRLQADLGWSDGQTRAYLVAADAVRRTQFEYARWARPRLMDGGRAVIFMFKSFLQNMLYVMFRSNRGVQARMLLGFLATAGLMGLPGAEDIEDVVKTVSRMLGYDVDPERWFRGMVKEFLHSDAADVMLHGASRIGFGIPAALQSVGVPASEIDLSGSLSMGRLIPGLAPVLDIRNGRFNELVGETTVEIAGPAIGVPFAAYQALIDHSLPANDIKRWERVLPRAGKAISRASRFLVEERERDRRGGTIIEFDPNDVSDQMEIISTAAGFAPTRLNRKWDYLRSAQEVEHYYLGMRRLLMNEYWRAFRLRNADGKEDAVKAIRKFNAETPFKSMAITADSLRQSVKARVRGKEQREADIPTAKMLRPIRAETRELYPEVEVRRVR